MKRKDTTLLLKATQTFQSLCSCLLAGVNPSPVSTTLSDTYELDGRKHMDSKTIDSGKRVRQTTA